MTFPPKVWDGVLCRLAAEMPVFAFESWVATLVPELGDHELRLLAPTPFHRNRVRETLLERIGELVRDELGAVRSVTVDVGGDAHARASADARARAVLASLEAGDTGGARGPTTVAAECDCATHARRNSDVDGTADGTTAAPAGRADRGGGVGAQAPRLALRGDERARAATAFDQRFDNFVVGPSNALAREAAFALATARHDGLRLLYLHAEPGMGKTHLARAVCGEVGPSERARYATAEAFTNAFTAAVKARKMEAFKQRVRERCDVLVIDDVPFLAGKPGTQLELFHTVQHLVDAGRRVVLTGDRPARELTELEPQLRGLLASAFVAPLDPPDDALRREILRAKAAAGGVRLPTACVDLLVESLSGSLRELDAALAQIVTTAALLERPIDAALARDVLATQGALAARRARRPTPELVVKVVAQFFQTTPAALAARSRRRDVLVPRQLAIFLCRRFTDASLVEIGRAVGRETPAVRNAIRAVEKQVLERAPSRYQLEAVSERVREAIESGEPEPVRRAAFVRLVRADDEAQARRAAASARTGGAAAPSTVTPPGRSG